MAALPAQGIAKITINGEEYMPTPHEVNPELPEDTVWTQWPPNSLYLSDPAWYDATGQDVIKQRRVWAAESTDAQIAHFATLLDEHPSRRLDMMFAAAVKGKPDVVRFLLGQGVKATAVMADRDDVTLVPLHAAAYQGHLDCVRIFIEEAGLATDSPDELGGTPLMRACWGRHADVAQYLIGKGADILARQTAQASRDEEGTSPFEFASGSGSVACAELIVTRAHELGVRSSGFANRLALEAAAQSGNPVMLEFVLGLGDYPRLRNEHGDLLDGPLLLTQPMKDDLEAAFKRALLQAKSDSLSTLFAYIDSRGEDGEYNWVALKGETIDALIEAALEFAVRDDEEHRGAFVIISKILFDPNSRFQTLYIREKRDIILANTFFVACQHGCVDTLRLIDAAHQHLDVNQLSRVKPVACSGLYIAVVECRAEVVKYLFSEHKEQLDIHLGNGQFANGPTPLWAAVRSGNFGITRLLLESGGPMDYIDDSARPEGGQSGMKKVVLTSTKTIRAPVRVISHPSWAKDNSDKLGEPADKGSYTDSDGNEVHFVTLELESRDLQWWDKLQLRMNDDELRSIEKGGRQMKMQTDVV